MRIYTLLNDSQAILVTPDPLKIIQRIIADNEKLSKTNYWDVYVSEVE